MWFRKINQNSIPYITTLRFYTHVVTINSFKDLLKSRNVQNNIYDSHFCRRSLFFGFKAIIRYKTTGLQNFVLVMIPTALHNCFDYLTYVETYLICKHYILFIISILVAKFKSKTKRIKTPTCTLVTVNTKIFNWGATSILNTKNFFLFL